MTLSLDGKTLAISGGDTIALHPLSWDKSSGVQVGASRLIDCSSLMIEGAPTFSPDGRLLAMSSSRDNSIHVWETASGKERTRFEGIADATHLPLSFSADGRRLASGGLDSTILIWDVTGRLRDGGDLRTTRLSDKELESLWTDLKSSDAVRAGNAIWKLVAAGPSTVSFMKTRLRPIVPHMTPEALDRLLADLDANDFAIREKAQNKLEQLGEECEPAVRRALAKHLSLEARHSLQRLFSQLEVVKNEPVGEVLRGVRSVEVLEQIGTPEARHMLEKLISGMTWSLQGTYWSRPTEEALAALKRLK